jgi:hypothetical protein
MGAAHASAAARMPRNPPCAAPAPPACPHATPRPRHPPRRPAGASSRRARASAAPPRWPRRAAPRPRRSSARHAASARARRSAVARCAASERSRAIQRPQAQREQETDLPMHPCKDAAPPCNTSLRFACQRGVPARSLRPPRLQSSLLSCTCGGGIACAAVRLRPRAAVTASVCRRRRGGRRSPRHGRQRAQLGPTRAPGTSSARGAGHGRARHGAARGRTACPVCAAVRPRRATPRRPPRAHRIVRSKI